MACLNFTLYPNSSFPRSIWRNDIRRLTQICQRFAGGHYSIEIIHLAEDRQRAFHDGVFATPTIILEVEGGRKNILGNLVDTEKFLKSRQELAVRERPEPLSLLTILSACKAV